jgi:glycolate dehydrogenase FAD-binding subunit
LQSVSEVAETVRAAAGAGQRIAVSELDLSGLDRILEHEAGDLTCTVEAGIRLSALQAALAEHGQRLSLDPAADPTVGACLAADLHGPLSHRYGRLRDLLLGVTVVLGDGLVASAGGKVVKNVAGYDLGKLMSGSWGTLGIVVRASLRLHPVPFAAGTHVSEGGVEEKARAIRRSTLAPSALDVTPERIAVLFEGSPNAVATQLETAKALVGGEAVGSEVWDEVRERMRDEQQSRVVAVTPLLERLRAGLDPQGVFA